jgi:hypothetical protein
MLTRQITELQRAIIKGDDDSQFNVVFQIAKSLLQLGEHETTMSNALRTALEEQKRLRNLIRKEDLELEETRAKDKNSP